MRKLLILLALLVVAGCGGGNVDDANKSAVGPGTYIDGAQDFGDPPGPPPVPPRPHR